MLNWRNVARARNILGIALLGAGVVWVTRAYAGSRETQTWVAIDPEARTANGPMGAVFNSTGVVHSLSEIGCEIDTTPLVKCVAHNYTFDAVCTTNAADFDTYAKVLAAITPDSYIQFSWDTNNKCTSLKVKSSSRYIPKVYP